MSFRFVDLGVSTGALDWDVPGIGFIGFGVTGLGLIDGYFDWDMPVLGQRNVCEICRYYSL